MTISRGLAITGDVQNILFHRDFLENDLNTKKPGSPEIEVFVDTTIDEINMYLGTVGYTLPIVSGDSPYGYWWTRNWNAIGAAEKTERRAGGKEQADALKEDFDGMRDSILNHIVILSDVPGAPTDAELAASGTSDLDEFGNIKEPFFTRSQEW